MSSEASPDNDVKKPYRVLARKYRPQNFDELIGQDALVRTLSNAIEQDRVAHAFMLNGVRGVGKTTTARIIAKALNYTGADGKAEPTTGDTSDCALCNAIAEDRHPDVIEIDAASHTGVDEMREILSGVPYAPTEARYKIYIIDEVHMLSKSAFNALLKTLEEPPPHVKFIFATTEIEKVPVTILSRCQRFDLRRVGFEELLQHYKNIAEKEGVTAEDEALSMIARAADGSVRDGLSLLDQAMAMGDGSVNAEQVKAMIGLADRGILLELLDNILAGKIKEALGVLDILYQTGANPVHIVQELLNLTHQMTKIKTVGVAEPNMAQDQVEKLGSLAKSLSMPALGKAWQLLLKGLKEIEYNYNSQSILEMLVIRMCYAAELPDPSDLIKKISNENVGGSAPQSVASSGGGAPSAKLGVVASSGAAMQTVAQPDAEQAFSTLEDIVGFLDSQKEVLLASQVFQYVHLVSLREQFIELRLAENAPQDLVPNLTKSMRALTRDQWMITLSNNAGQPTLAEKKNALDEEKKALILNTDMVKEFLQVFPDAKLTAILGD